MSWFSMDSPHPVSESGFDRRTCVQSSQHGDRGNRRASKLRRDVRGDGGKAQNVDVKLLGGPLHRLEILTAVVSQPEVQTLPGRGLLGHVGMTFELVADCSPD